MALSWLGPAGCRPHGHDSTAPSEPRATGTSAPAPATAPSPVSEGSTPEAAEASAATSSTTADPNAKADRSNIDRLWMLYNVVHDEPERLKNLDRLLQEHLDEHPDEPRALQLRAEIRLLQDRYDEALAAAERCVAVAPETASCWLTVGVVEETLGSAVRALEAYRRYLELAPDGTYAPDARKAIERLDADRHLRS